MKVAESAVAQVAAQARPESQSATKPKPRSSENTPTGQAGASAAKQTSGASEVVRLSSQTSQKTDVVERQNAPKPDSQQASNTGGQDNGAKPLAPEAKPLAPEGNLSKNIGRDYSVEQGQVVVKVIDKENDKVVREIPPEELRRIKQAISEINRNSVALVEKRAAKEADQASTEQRKTETASSASSGVDVTT
ncbi:hypothetical protein MNBD_NITROSPINAE03-1123 [hydrothermal vent metagenome]|uniref:Flagellar protein FlaG n=1 Tax=hydrothermal vent metagenome TaxID=652676 RepID=A0A3B1CFP4_9ZZZZ